MWSTQVWGFLAPRRARRPAAVGRVARSRAGLAVERPDTTWGQLARRFSSSRSSSASSVGKVLAEELVVGLDQGDLLPPRLGVDLEQLGDGAVVDVQAVGVERLGRGHAADRRVDRIGGRRRPARAPTSSTRLFSPKPGHRNEPSSPLRNQLTQNSFGQLVGVGGLADVEPVGHVVAGVVAHERQHGERVEADLADRAGRGGGLLRAHDRAEERAVLPVERLGDERDVGGPAAAEQDRRDRHAGRVLPLRSDRRALLGRSGEAGVGVGGRGAGLGRPVVALPVDQVGRDVSSVRPSHQTSPSSVFATLVKMQLAWSVFERVGVGPLAGAGGDAEEAGLGVDGVQPAVVAELHPGDVVADRLDLPTGQRRDEHGHVGLAAGRRERGGDVLLLAVRAG